MRSASVLLSHPALSPASEWRQQSASQRTSRLRNQRESLGRALKQLRPCAEAVSVAANETIFCEGDNAANVYIVNRGVVRLCMTKLQGDRMICDFVLANEPLGAMGSSSYTWTAEAATDVDLVRLSRAEAENLLGQSGTRDLLSSYAWQLAANAWRFQRAMVEQSPDQRLACFLIRFSQRTGTPVGRPMSLSMSRRDIACHLGVSLQELSRGFEVLAGQRAIHMSIKGTCTVLDATAVIELALRAVLPNGAPRWQRSSPDLSSILA